MSPKMPFAPLIRAISPRSWGGPEVLTEIEVPRPEPGPGEILVRVHAAGVNAADWKARATGGLGLWGDPPILGYDVSGHIEALGSGVTLFARGDEVFGMPRFPHQAGAYADYVVAPARHFALKPEALDHARAAALPLASLTAWQSLYETAHIQPGGRVLIHGAAGGVGHVAVQIAKALGAYVIGTASKSKHPFLRSLGADEVIDYRAVDFDKATCGIDVVIDVIGGDYGPRSLRVLREGGMLVSLSSPAEDRLRVESARSGLRAGFLLVEPDHAGMKAVAAFVSDGKLRPELAAELPLERAAHAHALGESGHTSGKIVLRVHRE